MKTAVLFLFDRDREIGNVVIADPLSSICGGGVSDRDITKIPGPYGKGGLVRVNVAFKGPRKVYLVAQSSRCPHDTQCRNRGQ